MSRTDILVGFFDSGLGGLCILDAFRRTCPGVSTVYLADSSHCPYGNRPPAEIVELALANTRRLVGLGCGMIVVACNTATAAAIDTLRKTFPDIPFVGLEPAIKPAALHSKSGVVGVLATAGTFNGRLYRETSARVAKNVTVLATVADEFVTLVENCPRLATAATDGDANAENCADCPRSTRCRETVRRRIEPLLNAGADHLVLGCTHFPHLKPLIEEVAAGRATAVDPSEAVAQQAKRLLAQITRRQTATDAPIQHRFIRT